MSPKTMIPFDDAARIVLEQAFFLGAEDVPLDQALHRVLAADVRSDMDMPPFHKSAMDGYACRREDLRRELAVTETIPAGKAPQQRIGPNQCAKIMTGAMLPDGADCVVQIEHTETAGTNAIRVTQVIENNHICRKGEDIREGDVVLTRGTLLRPQHLGVLATVGCVRPSVARRPSVGVIATGDELVEPDRRPALSQIRNSNGQQLVAHAASTGAHVEYLGIAADTGDTLLAAVSHAQSRHHIVLLTGGVSMGDFDIVPGILQNAGFRLLFEKIAIKPGMPTVFGVGNRQCVFGLPGNPVSTFVIFEILVKPLIFKLMGHDFQPLSIPMRLDKPIQRRKTDRDTWTPVRLTRPGAVEAVAYHGPAHLNSIAQACGLICVPRDTAQIPEGTVVHVRPI